MSYRGSGPILEGAERFNQPQGHISIRRILPGGEGHIPSQHRQIQCPINQQQQSTAFAAPGQMPQEQPCGESESRQHLQDPTHAVARCSPVPARAHSTNSLPCSAQRRARHRLDTNRYQPEQRVQVETAQRAGMHPHSKIALCDDGLCKEGKSERDDSSKKSDGCASGDPAMRSLPRSG